MKYKILKILGFIIALVFVISFLNIQIKQSADNMTSIWCFIWKPDKQHVLMSIVSYIGILLTLIPFTQFFNKELKKPILLSYVGIAILWIIVLIFFPFLCEYQRENLLNYQYTFLLSTLFLILNKSIWKEYKSK